jgi:hypothetical protein
MPRRPKNASKSKAGSARDVSVEARLRRELQRLQQRTRLGLELDKVLWLPSKKVLNPAGKPLAGEVKGKTIYVYEEDAGEALKTLKHEFFDYVISHRLEKPYKEFINRLIGLFEAEMYRRKEELIDRLSELV